MLLNYDPQLIDMTGASVTNKGIFYEAGKEPQTYDAPPKLHLLIESNEEWRVSQKTLHLGT